MLVNLFVIGVSWHNASVSVREKMAFSKKETPDILQAIISLPLVKETVILSTCNRVEIYGVAPVDELSDRTLYQACQQVRDFWIDSRCLDTVDDQQCLVEKTGKDAIHHLFRVVSSLDSMVIGEAQILGQVKHAYTTALNHGVVGSVLGQSMSRAFSVAKKVRTETRITQGAANVSSIAVELAGRVFDHFSNKTILLLGAGKMNTLAAKHLRSAGVTDIVVINRSLSKAQLIADEISAKACSWESLEDNLDTADVMISSTASKDYVVSSHLMTSLMKQRQYRPIVIVDIAVPRDVDPDVGNISGVYLFDIDDLKKAVDQNIKERQLQAKDAECLVNEKTNQFETWWHAQDVIPVIKSLRLRIQQTAMNEAEIALRDIRSLTNSDTSKNLETVVYSLTDRIVKKVLHTPMNALKHSEDNLQTITLAEATKRLFDLSIDTEHGTAISENTQDNPIRKKI